MDFSFSSGEFGFVRCNFPDLFSLTPNLLFGFPDNLFSNRICIPPLPIFAITRRGLVAAFIGGQAVAVTVWPPLGEINGRSGFVWFLRPHCLFWTGMVTAASIGKLHRWIRNFTDVWKLNKTLRPLCYLEFCCFPSPPIASFLWMCLYLVWPLAPGCCRSLIYNEGLGQW